MKTPDATTFNGAFHDLNQLSELKYGDASTEKDRLEKAAREFETMFVNELFKSARKTQELLAKDNPMHSSEMSTYQGMLDQEMALQMGRQGGMGIADMLVRQFTDRQDSPEPKELRRTPQDFSPLEITKAAPPASMPIMPAARVETSVKPVETTPKQENFVNKMAVFAKGAADKLGIPVSHIVAQAALESGWGEHVPASEYGRTSHNYFGIKAQPGWNGEAVVKETQEFKQGLWVTERAAFRAYPGMQQALDDYAQFIQKPRYEAALNNPEGYFEALQDGGYATDPDYAEKARSVLNQVEAILADNTAPGALDS